MAKSKLNRAVAIFLAVVMCFTMTTTIGFGATNGGDSAAGDEVNLLVFGNSTSSGYGMPDFRNYANGFSKNNNDLYDEVDNPDGAWTVDAADAADMGKMSVAAYPWKLKKYIAQQECGGDLSKVNLMPLCMNGLRTDELRAFLDDDFYQEAAAREYAYGKQWNEDNEKGLTEAQLAGNYAGFMNSHMGWYLGNYHSDGLLSEESKVSHTFADGSSGTVINPEAVNECREFIKGQIADADVIVVDVCGNNFGTYIGYRMAAYLGLGNMYTVPNTYETIDDVKDLPDNIKAKIKDLQTSLTDKYEMLATGAGAQLLNAFVYGAADCIVNYTADLEYINQLKKDNARVIVVGLNNPMEGLSIDMNGKEIDFGEVTGTLFKMVNKYITTLDPSANDVYFASLPEDMVTFAGSVAKAEDLDALLNDGNGADGLGAYAINRIYNNFMDEFNVSEDGSAQTVYAAVQDGIKTQKDCASAKFPAWSSLGDETPITFEPTQYVVVDTSKIESSNPAEMISNTDDPNTVEYPKTFLTKQLMNNYVVMDKSGEELYALVQNLIKVFGDIPTAQFPAWNELGDTTPVTFDPATYYVTYDTTKNALTEALNATPDPRELPEGTVLLTKGMVKGFVKHAVQGMLQEAVKNHTAINVDGFISVMSDMDSVKNGIMQYLAASMMGADTSEYDDAAWWGLLTIEERFLLSSGLGEHPNAVGCDQKYQAVKKAYDSSTTAYEDSIAELKALLDEIRELLNGTPVGDDLEAAIEKINKANELFAVLEEAGLTADQLKDVLAMKDELQERVAFVLDAFDTSLEELIAMADELSNDPEKMSEVVNKINQLKEVMAIIDEEGLTAEQLKQLFETKKELEARITAVLAEFDMTIDDLVAMIDEATSDPAKMQELVNKFNQINAALELLDEEGLTVEQLQALLQAKDELQARITDTLAIFGLTLDDLYNAAMAATEPEALQAIVDQIKTMQDLINRIPKTKEEAKAELLKQLDNIQALLEENATFMSEDLMEQLKRINEMLKQAVTDEDFSAIAEELLPIGQKLLAIGEAVADLPAYQEAMNEYLKLSDETMANLQDRITVLEDQALKLMAKAIDADITTEVTFPNKSAMVTASWATDEDAAGYDFTRNGQEADFAAIEGGMSYEDTDVQIGETYTYEVTPYVAGKNGEKVYGRTFKASVVPEVNVEKAKLKKVKKGSKAFKAKWAAVADADGYQVSYKVGKKTKMKTVAADKLAVKVKKLKAGKYTVKVRATKTVNNVEYYGAWSKAKKVAVK